MQRNSICSLESARVRGFSKAKPSTFANSIAALRKKFQLNGTNLVLKGRLLAGHALSHLLRESNHKRQREMVRIVVVNEGSIGSPVNAGDWPGCES